MNAAPGKHYSSDSAAQLPAIDTFNLRQWVQSLSGLRHGSENPEALEKKAVFIEFLLRSFGLSVISQPVLFSGRTYRNLIATIHGSTQQLPMLLLGAHYDGPMGSPGADDNASGVTVLLETARRLAGRTPRHTIRFVAFTLEEPQRIGRFLIGSQDFAKKARQRGERYQIAVILESVGFRDFREGSQLLPPLVRVSGVSRGDFLAVIGNHQSRVYTKRFSLDGHRNAPNLPIVPYCAPRLLARLIPQLFLSDHAAFWKEGYPALMLTDTVPLRNPHYHRPSDTPETLDYNFLLDVAKAAGDTLWQWANE